MNIMQQPINITHQPIIIMKPPSTLPLIYLSNDLSAHNYTLYLLTASLAESACLMISVMSANG